MQQMAFMHHRGVQTMTQHTCGHVPCSACRLVLALPAIMVLRKTVVSIAMLGNGTVAQTVRDSMLL